MKKLKKSKSVLEGMQELGRKHGVKVSNMSERGVRAIGIVGGVRKKDHGHWEKPGMSNSESGH